MDNLMGQIQDTLWVAIAKSLWDTTPAEKIETYSEKAKLIEAAKMIHCKEFDCTKVIEDQDELWKLFSEKRDTKFDTILSKSSPAICMGRTKQGFKIFLRFVSVKVSGFAAPQFMLQVVVFCHWNDGEDFGLLTIPPHSLLSEPSFVHFMMVEGDKRRYDGNKFVTAREDFSADIKDMFSEMCDELYNPKRKKSWWEW